MDRKVCDNDISRDSRMGGDDASRNGRVVMMLAGTVGWVVMIAGTVGWVEMILAGLMTEGADDDVCRDSRMGGDDSRVRRVGGDDSWDIRMGWHCCDQNVYSSTCHCNCLSFPVGFIPYAPFVDPLP